MAEAPEKPMAADWPPDEESEEAYEQRLKDFCDQQGGAVDDVIALAAKWRSRFLSLRFRVAHPEP